MWIIILTLLFGSTIGILGKVENCSKNILDVCKPNKDTIREMPGTKEELNSACSDLLRVVNCLSEFIDSCGAETAPRHLSVSQLEKVTVLLQDVCSEESELHKNLAENIGCVKSVLMDDVKECRDKTEKRIDAYKELIEQSEEDTTGEAFEVHWRNAMCLKEYFGMKCYGQQAESKCGSTAGNVVTELGTRSIEIDGNCEDVDIDELITLLDSIEKGDEPAADVEVLLDVE